MTDDQLIESLRARMWPGDCEAAAVRFVRPVSVEGEAMGVTK